MTLDDALVNWLQIKWVSEERPNDKAAHETVEFFTEILRDDFGVERIRIEKNASHVVLYFDQYGEPCTKQFPHRFVDQLLEAIENEPKFGS